MNQALKLAQIDHGLPHQAEAIRRLLFDAYTIEAHLLGVTDFPPLRRTADHIQQTEAVFWGIRRDDRLIALVEIETEQDGSAHIASFVVDPRCFRQGLGSKLLSLVLNQLRVNVVTVSTAEKNLPAIRLYQKHGFEHASSWSIEGFEMVTLTWHRATASTGPASP